AARRAAPRRRHHLRGDPRPALCRLRRAQDLHVRRPGGGRGDAAPPARSGGRPARRADRAYPRSAGRLSTMGGAFPQLFRAWRTLWRRPGFLVVSVLTRALGVGSVSAIYSVVDGVLLSPLPYPQAGQILRLHRVQQNWSGPVSAPAFRDWQEATRGEFAALAAFTGVTLNLTGEGEAERIVGYRVSPAFWDVMGLGPAHGRWFSEAEDAAAERVAVLGHGFWQRR